MSSSLTSFFYLVAAVLFILALARPVEPGDVAGAATSSAWSAC